LETYEQLQLILPGQEQSNRENSPSFPQASLASHIALREKVRAMVMSATYGTRLQDVSENLNRDGLSAKIRPVYSQGRMDGISQEWLTAYPRWGIVSAGECGELVMSEPITKETGCLSLGTPTASMKVWSKRFREGCLTNPAEIVAIWPTPTVNGNYNRKGASKTSGNGLATVVKQYPTPVASGKLSGGSGTDKKIKKPLEAGLINEETCRSMIAGNGGKLNPQWVEWLMGFPQGWTDLDV